MHAMKMGGPEKLKILLVYLSKMATKSSCPNHKQKSMSLQDNGTLFEH